MRKITTNATNAFMMDRPFCEGNTAVTVDGEYTTLSLHGNEIAFKTNFGSGLTTSTGRPPYVAITNCGWFTRVTKDRLNGIPGVVIYAKNGDWYLNGEKWDGKIKTIA